MISSAGKRIKAALFNGQPPQTIPLAVERQSWEEAAVQASLPPSITMTPTTMNGVTRMRSINIETVSVYSLSKRFTRHNDKSPYSTKQRRKVLRKIIVYNVISLDGYHTGVGNDPSVMFPMMGNVFDSYNAELLRTVDVHLMGRLSFELFQSFWPKVAENPTSEEFTDAQRDLSQAGKTVKGIVVSDTLEGHWQGLRIIRRRDAHAQIAELKRQEGKDILITGSRTLWNDLLAHGLVDEIHLLIGNRILGQGVPVFAGQTSTTLRLIETRRWAESDNVLLRYEVLHQSA